MYINFIKINSGNDNSPSSLMIRVNYYYHTKITKIIRSFTSMTRGQYNYIFSMALVVKPWMYMYGFLAKTLASVFYLPLL